VAAGLLALFPLFKARIAEAQIPLEAKMPVARRRLPRAARLRRSGVRRRARHPVMGLLHHELEKPDRDRLAFYARAASAAVLRERAQPRRPVVDEGSDLVYYVRGRRPELLGLATGGMALAQLRERGPDEGWAANEARRIAGAADPCAWMYFTH
jgi:hypothetical protein